MIFFCGDPHGRFDHILEAAERYNPAAVVLLGDIESPAPLSEVLEPIHEITWFIHGNHDTDTERNFAHVWDDSMSPRNLHGQAVELPGGVRVAGLGGVFRGSVWYPDRSAPDPGPHFRNPKEHAERTPRQDRCRGMQHRKHWSTIYPDTVDHLANLEADILVSHEAPGYHPAGFEILDTLAQSMRVRLAVHGHHHDCLDSSHRWDEQGFQSHGVGLRGITALTREGEMVVIRPGDLDHHRQARTHRMFPT